MSSHVIHVIHAQRLFPAKFVPWSLCHLRLHLASPGTGRCLSSDWRSFAITSPSTGERHSIPRASGKNHQELAENWKQWVVVLGRWLIYEVSLKPHEMLFVSVHWFKSPVGSAPRWYKLQFLNFWNKQNGMVFWSCASPVFLYHCTTQAAYKVDGIPNMISLHEQLPTSQQQSLTELLVELSRDCRYQRKTS